MGNEITVQAGAQSLTTGYYGNEHKRNPYLIYNLVNWRDQSILFFLPTLPQVHLITCGLLGPTGLGKTNPTTKHPLRLVLLFIFLLAAPPYTWAQGPVIVPDAPDRPSAAATAPSPDTPATAANNAAPVPNDPSSNTNQLSPHSSGADPNPSEASSNSSGADPSPSGASSNSSEADPNPSPAGPNPSEAGPNSNDANLNPSKTESNSNETASDSNGAASDSTVAPSQSPSGPNSSPETTTAPNESPSATGDPAKTPGNPEPASSEPIPSPDELEARGATIGKIEFIVQDVFDTSNPKENNKLFRAANALHISTKHYVIEEHILFKSGDPYVHRTIEESERILRSNEFLYDAKIRPIRYHNNKVDIEVLTRDVWTLTGSVNFQNKGGVRDTGFEIEDQNLLGHGKRISLQRSRDADRSENLIEYYDPLFTKERLQMTVGYSNNSDGWRKSFDLERPFYSLDSRWSFGVNWDNSARTDTLYRDYEQYQRFNFRETVYGVFGGYSMGLEHNRISRFTLGFASEEVQISRNSETDLTRPLPPNRAVSYPWIGFNRIDNHFIKATRVDLIERTEDINIGMEYDVKVGASNRVFGAMENRLIVEGFFTKGYRPLRPDNLLLSSAKLTGRLSNTHAENMLLETKARFFLPAAKHQVNYARLQFDVGHDLDEDKQLLLGGQNGLRGYPANYREGNRRFLLNLERRFYGTHHLWQLFYVGAAAFFDVGSAWQNEARRDSNFEALRDYGLGLRLSSSRSGRGQVLHFDLAYALDGDNSISKRQRILSIESTF